MFKCLLHNHLASGCLIHLFCAFLAVTGRSTLHWLTEQVDL